MWLLTGEELKIVLFVARRTRGFQRESARVTARQMIEGTRTAEGRVLDHGTGLGRATVKARLMELKRLGVLVEVSPNNPLNEGPEYRLPREEEVDWGALHERRNVVTARAAERCERARQERTPSARGGLSDNPPPGLWDSPAPGLSDNPAPRVCSTDHPRVCPTDHPPVCETDRHPVCPTDHPPGACKERNPEETQREIQGEVGGDPRAGTADPSECRPLLESIGVSEALITYLCRDTQRCYWAARWATWWPCVAARVGEGQMNRFIQNRVKGAVAGRDEDRQPPAEWWDFEAEREKAALRQAASRRRDADRDRGPETRFGRGAEPLFRGLVGALDPVLRGHLACAETAAVEDGTLVVRFRKSVNQQWLERRSETVLARAREAIPSFPEVRFELVKEAGRG